MDEIIIRGQRIVDIEDIYANEYNPNRMPQTEMKLLSDCIIKYGFLFPIIVAYNKEKGKFRIIDGYHRYETLKKIGAKRVSIINLNLTHHDAIQLTVLMNRIKGMHQVELMSDLLVNLEDLGLMDDEICKNLGMETEEYLRLKQQLGIAHSFKSHEYSKSWE